MPYEAPQTSTSQEQLGSKFIMGLERRLVWPQITTGLLYTVSYLQLMVDMRKQLKFIPPARHSNNAFHYAGTDSALGRPDWGSQWEEKHLVPGSRSGVQRPIGCYRGGQEEGHSGLSHRQLLGYKSKPDHPWLGHLGKVVWWCEIQNTYALFP